MTHHLQYKIMVKWNIDRGVFFVVICSYNYFSMLSHCIPVFRKCIFKSWSTFTNTLPVTCTQSTSCGQPGSPQSPQSSLRSPPGKYIPSLFAFPGWTHSCRKLSISSSLLPWQTSAPYEIIYLPFKIPQWSHPHPSWVAHKPDHYCAPGVGVRGTWHHG